MAYSLRAARLALGLATSLLVASCGSGGDIDNELAFRVIHAAPDAPAVNVLLDGVVFRSGVPYKQTTGLTFVTPRNYTFGIEALVPSGTVAVFPAVTVSLEAGREYTVMAIGEGAAGATHPIQPLIIENAVEAIPADSARLQFVHAAPGVAPLDVYLTRVPAAPAPLPGIDAAPPVAALTYAQQPAARQLTPAGAYVVRVTPAGDASNVLFTSDPLALSSRFDALLVLVANSGAGNSPISLLLDSQFGSREFPDRDTPSVLRTVHLSPDAPALDVIGLPATTSFPEVLFTSAANPVGVALDPANDRALVVDNQLRAVVAVDLLTGVRTVLSDNVSPDTATPFGSPVGIALDTVNNRALVTDVGRGAVLAVDLQTGARTVLSDALVPDAANPLSGPVAIAVDAANARALVVDNRTDQVLAVNLQTGARTILSAAGTPDSVNPFVAPVGIAVDGSRALVVDNALDAVLAVDLATGTRTVLSSGTVPDAVNPLGSPVAIAVDAANGRALVVDNRLRAVVAVSLATGARTILSGSTVPDGSNPFGGPAGVALSAAGDAALVMDARLDTLLGVDPGTGGRSVLSAGGAPAGLAYLASTAYVSVIPDTYALRAERTAAPDPANPLFGTTRLLDRGNRTTVFAAGLIAGLTAIVATDDTRPVFTEGKLRFMDAAPGSGTVDVYVLDAGETLDEASPALRNLIPGSLIGHGGFEPGTYTIVFTAAGEKSALAPAAVVNAAAGTAHTVILVDEVRVDAASDGKPPAVLVLDDLAG